MYRIVFFCVSSLLLLSYACNEPNKVKLPYYNTPDFSPIFIEDEEEVPKFIQHTIADFDCINQNNMHITQSDIEGKIHIANFIFTSCLGICPSMTNNMKILSDSLSSDQNVVLLSFSVTPWLDKPSILKNYKEVHNITNMNWHFLTGAKSDIYTLARQSYFAEEDLGYSKDSSEFLHTEHFILVDKNKRIRGIYNGTLKLEMFQLLEDIQYLKTED